MRELTFAGFLSRYVRELSLSGTNAISILAREAAEKNYRLREPLLLYALFTDKVPLLRKSIRNDKLKRHAESILGRYDRERMLHALEGMEDGLPAEYRKVWRSYLVRKNRKKAEAHTKELTRQRVIHAAGERHFEWKDLQNARPGPGKHRCVAEKRGRRESQPGNGRKSI